MDDARRMLGRLIAVCGSGDPAGSSDDPIEGARILALAEGVGREIALAGCGLVCGGSTGVMLAACRGARTAGGLCVGVLPGYDPDEATPYVDVHIPTGLGHARNVIVAASGRAVIAVGGEWGTLSEIAFAMRLQRPVIGLRTWQLARHSTPDARDYPGFYQATDAADAVRLALHHANLSF